MLSEERPLAKKFPFILLIKHANDNPYKTLKRTAKANNIEVNFTYTWAECFKCMISFDGIFIGSAEGATKTGARQNAISLVLEELQQFPTLMVKGHTETNKYVFYIPDANGYADIIQNETAVFANEAFIDTLAFIGFEKNMHKRIFEAAFIHNLKCKLGRDGNLYIKKEYNYGAIYNNLLHNGLENDKFLLIHE